MKKNKTKKMPDDGMSPARQRVRKGLHLFGRAVNFVGDTAAGTVGAVFKIIGTVLLILLVSGMLFACVFAYYVKTCLTPNLDLSLEDFKLNESSTIWYQDAAGEWRELVNLSGKEKRVWVDYDEIPWYMEKALVAIEDKRFYNHKGVDWYRTAGAFVEMFARMQTSYGGSTITQQLIKNLTGENEITIQRKLTEIFGALELEKKYDKREIMEWYLNAVYFGEGCWGVQTAAQTYFGKDVKDLSMAECAAIVGITNLPTYYDPFYNEENNKKRQETILWEMYDQGFIDHAQYEQAKNEELTFTRTPGEEYTQEIMSYYTEMVIDDVIADLMKLKGIGRDTAKTLLYNGGYQIYCCLDTGVQACIDQIYTNLNAIPYTRSEQQLQSAIVVMDPYDGRILGISGGVGEKTINFGLNRATGTYRSPGSSIKPIASYGPAVDLGLITPDTLVLDENNISLRGTSWFPQNDGGQNYGLVTIYSALQYSLNTVAAQIVDKLPMGPQTSYDYLTTRLGVTSLVPADCDYAPMALGQLTNGITVREMCQAYCAFVNDGIFTYGRSYSMVSDKQGNVVIDNAPNTIQAFKPNTAYTMTYMMQNGVEHGTGTEAALWTVPVAGKTGTSGDYKDRWFVGCTPYYTAAVWTGYDTPEIIHVSGNPASQIWRKVMAPVHEGLGWKSFPYPQLGGNTGIFGVYDTPVYNDREYYGGTEGWGGNADPYA
ncbi:MAG: PBP1A family penicillin-binding protein [Eubacteriales bacterium]|nr:PBP1A family penicillin-binding protein [Eubacteriales bacterium]